jgi:hypothetical protein
MRSGEARPARDGSARRELVQGSLDGILSTDEPAERARERPPSPKSAVSEPSKSPGKKRMSRSRGDDDAKDAALRASLDALEENITLLLARHESLAAAHAADEERRRTQDAPDPVELEQRVRALEAENQKLERHSAFLEDRIRGLLSRVRYVIES